MRDTPPKHRLDAPDPRSLARCLPWRSGFLCPRCDAADYAIRCAKHRRDDR